MKKIFSFFVSFICVATLINAQSVSVNTDGSAADASSILDVKSTTKGMLVPRMTTAQRTTIVAPATGLLIFDTDTKTFWYFNGTIWTNVSAPAGGNGWSLTGNSATDPVIHFMGTTDNKPFILKSNNSRVGYFKAHGDILIGENAGINLPSYSYGSVAIGNGALYYATAGNSSVAIGDSALSKNGTVNDVVYAGSWNTAIGIQALKSNTSGRSNTGLGFFSLSSNTTGALNTAVGYNTLTNNESGWQNTAIGESSLYNNTQGSANSALGSYAMYSNTTGRFNTAFGAYSLYSNQSGNNNTAIGSSALYNNLTGYSNVAIGKDALQKNKCLNNTIAIGDSALYSVGNYTATFFDGIDNTAIGSKSLFSNTTGYFNVGIGNYTLQKNISGIENTAFGVRSLNLNTSGNSNTAVGYSTLSVNTTGNNNTAVGYNADVSTGSLTNAMALGYNAVVNASNKIRLGNSSVTVIEGQVAYTTSDGRFKQNIKENVPGLDFIVALKPYTYQYKSYEMEKFINQGNPKKQAELKQDDFVQAENMVHMGFIAQEVDKLIKEKGYNLSVVHAPTNPTDNYSIAYGELIVPLVKAIQEQQKMIEALTKEVESLKTKKN